MKNSILLLLFLSPLVEAQHRILIQGPETSRLDYQKTLAQREGNLSPTDIRREAELRSTENLKTFAGHLEMALESKISPKELLDQVMIQKKTAFGDSHRKLWIDSLEKLETQSTLIRDELCRQKTITDGKQTQACGLGLTSFSLSPWRNLEFDEVLVDGVLFSYSQFLDRLWVQGPYRWVFLSNRYQPIVTIGNPEELKKNPPSLQLWDSDSFKEQLSSGHENPRFDLVEQDSSQKPWIQAKKNNGWYEQNKTWVWVGAVAGGAALVWALSNKHFEVSLGSIQF